MKGFCPKKISRMELRALLFAAIFQDLLRLCVAMPKIGKSCSFTLSCKSAEGERTPNTEICLFKGNKVGIHNVFSSLEISVKSSKDFIALEHTSLQALLKHLDTKEGNFFGRIFRKVGGLFVSSSYVSKNESKFERSPFSALYIGLLFDSEDDRVTEINCRQSLFDKKLVAFFIFGLALFFFAESCSRRMLFFYASGLTLGLLMSWMIILIIILKLIPYKKSLFFALAASGTSMGLYITQSMLMNLQFYAQYHAYWLLWYMGIVSLLTLAALYYKGPPKNIRTLNLVKWSLQLLGLLCIFNSTWALEVAVTSVVLTVTSYLSVQYLDVASLTKFKIRFSLFKLLRRKLRPPVKRFLTEEEYREQSQIETEKALKELRGFCSSPNCNSWKVVSRLKEPKRFASFVEKGKIFEEDELEEYEKFEAEKEEDSWLSSDEEQLPESTKDDILEESLQLSDASFEQS